VGRCDAGRVRNAGGAVSRRVADAGARGASVVRCVIDYTDVDALTVKRALLLRFARSRGRAKGRGGTGGRGRGAGEGGDSLREDGGVGGTPW
jgi:hypothetical protein